MAIDGPPSPQQAAPPAGQPSAPASPSGAPSPLGGEQALYLLALMAQLAQKAYRVPAPGAPRQPVGDQGYRTATSGPHAATSTSPVPLVAGVEVPVLPAGVVDRNYWFPDRSRSPIRPLRLRTRGPIRSAWSL